MGEVERVCQVPEADGIITYNYKPDASEYKNAIATARRKYGEGFAIYCAPDMGFKYAHCGPHKLSREIVHSLIADHIKLSYDIQALPNVTVNIFKKGNQTIIHLLDNSACMVFLGMEYPYRRAPGQILPYDFSPCRSVQLSLDSQIRKIHSPTETEFSHRLFGDRYIQINIAEFTHYAMIVLES